MLSHPAKSMVVRLLGCRITFLFGLVPFMGCYCFVSFWLLLSSCLSNSLIYLLNIYKQKGYFNSQWQHLSVCRQRRHTNLCLLLHVSTSRTVGENYTVILITSIFWIRFNLTTKFRIMYGICRCTCDTKSECHA